MSREQESFCAGFGAVAAVALIVLGLFFAWPVYSVWASRQGGKAELAHAEYSRQVAVQEANAKLHSASLLASAEVERAKGVAQANQIIGKSLEGNEAYLRYLWINNLGEAGAGHEVVYIPTEAGLPILEAGRRGQLAAAAK